MKPQNGVTEQTGWLAELAEGDLTGDALRKALAARIHSAGELEQAAREVEISRRVRVLMIRLAEAEIKVPADFEARLMARVGEDTALLNLLEVYLTAFGQTLIELLNALFSFIPEQSQTPEIKTT